MIRHMLNGENKYVLEISTGANGPDANLKGVLKFTI